MQSIAIVGRPNVGKSTLFNKLTRSKDAIVADYEGVTRDRKYGISSVFDQEYIFIDTGGVTYEHDGLKGETQAQAELAALEASIIFFIVDGSKNLSSIDADFLKEIRKLNKPTLLIINKADQSDSNFISTEFSSLGLKDQVIISAKSRKQFPEIEDFLQEHVTSDLTVNPLKFQEPFIAIIGAPNAGKSTLTNRYLNDSQVITSDVPGTTRDNIFLPCQKFDQDFTLVDTAGIRKKSKKKDLVEKFSLAKSLEAIRRSNAVIFLINAEQGLTENDRSLIGLTLEQGKSLAIGVNKWDLLSRKERAQFDLQYKEKLSFAHFVQRVNISALHGSSINDLLKITLKLFKQSKRKYSTSQLNNILDLLKQEHNPPTSGRFKIHLKYINQIDHDPLTLLVHGNLTEKLPDSYKRFLINGFRRSLKLKGAIIRMNFKSSNNPYAGK